MKHRKLFHDITIKMMLFMLFDVVQKVCAHLVTIVTTIENIFNRQTLTIYPVMQPRTEYAENQQQS
jgi:hypothetical protein